MSSGFAFHCHHDKLVEYVWDYDERVEYIKSNKPTNEVELRLKLFKLIPPERLPDKLNKARATYDKAWAACDKVLADYDKAELEKLHAELCPNCPWDGRTIFPKKEER